VSPAVNTARCGSYELVAQRENSMFVGEDGSVCLYAEHPYLVRLGPDADESVLRGALSIPRGGSEGQLRFGNFIGRAELGGRRLDVRSRRLDSAAAAEMLDDVSGWFSSLPFGVASPVSAGYFTKRERSPRVLYHAFALLRDAFRRLGPHDLCAALDQILARPYESLAADEPRLVPVGAVSRIDPETLAAIPSAPELLRRVAPGSVLTATPAVRRMNGLLPELIRARPFLHSTDNPENRFVAGAIDSMVDLLRRFERLTREVGGPARATNAREAAEISDFLRRCRRHRVLDRIRGTPEIPRHSSALRSKPGYRDLLRLHGELQARSHASTPHDAERLLESRDAADIYELWCYVKVVATLERLLGPPHARDRFEVTDFQAELRWGYSVSWPEVTALYNATFSRTDARGQQAGFRSYSLRLRPDIVLRSNDGRLNLLDAKMKRHFLGAVDAGDDGTDGAASDTFKPEDLHKMHAYRDALSADSVWVLYPGTRHSVDRFPAPEGPTGTKRPRFRGVGAIALKPSANHDGGLTQALAGLI
jgi:predicted component of viral defense system (DUF524 family)